RDAVRPAGTVLNAEVQDVITKLAERCRGGRAGQARAHHDQRVLPLVGGIDQLHFELVAVPLLGDRAGRDSGVERHAPAPCVKAQMAITTNPPAITTAAILPNARIRGVHLGLSMPSDWNELPTPCHKWDPTISM